jgi:hypothetical protein
MLLDLRPRPAPAVQAEHIEHSDDQPDRIYKPVDLPEYFQFDTHTWRLPEELIYPIAHGNEMVEAAKDKDAESVDGDADLAADGEAADAAVDDAEVVQDGEQQREAVDDHRAVQDEEQEVHVVGVLAVRTQVRAVHHVRQDQHPQVVYLRRHRERFEQV